MSDRKGKKTREGAKGEEEESQPPLFNKGKRFLQSHNVYRALKKIKSDVLNPNSAKDKGKEKLVDLERRTKHKEDPKI